MLLKRVNSPQDIKKLNADELSTYAQELRSHLIEIMNSNGGHVAANLGVVELSVALHFVFNTPEDVLIWDVGHQTYAHKAITGRREALRTLRKLGGVSGFTKMSESPFDSFGAGHSSTSLSAAAGFASALKIKGGDRVVVAVVGDGALSSGLAFEGLNNLGYLKASNVLVVLNDNNMGISVNSGWATNESARKKEFFESLGFDYQGVFDGHDIKAMTSAFSTWQSEVREGKLEQPRVIHLRTTKGKGYAPAEKNPLAFHGVPSAKGTTNSPALVVPTYTDIFSQTLCELAKQDPTITAVTAAMAEGTGLSEFRKLFPERFFDVGIAESHAVVFAAAQRLSGFKPALALYSTFAQRAFDQLIHDVALQKIPLALFLDRAGIVGADGPTHHGVFDLSYTRLIPEMVIMAPQDEVELQHMVLTALNCDKPSVVRFPRGATQGLNLAFKIEMLEVGKGEVVLQTSNNLGVVIWAIGTMVSQAKKAASNLQKKGLGCTVVNARFLKPLDKNLLLEQVKNLGAQGLLVTIEENTVVGGLGAAILECLAENNLTVNILNLGVPDQFVEHGSPTELLAKLGLDPAGIERAIEKRARG